MKEMIKKLQRKSNKKGFTLVEIIVVLVILAILAAIAVPAVLGYIDDAKESKYIQEARSMYIVVQTEEAKFRAENGMKAKETLTYGTQNAANKIIGTDEVKKAIDDKTEITLTTFSYDGTKKEYTFGWSEDGKTITAKLISNKDVKITTN